MTSKSDQATKLRSEIGNCYDFLRENKWNVQIEANFVNVIDTNKLISEKKANEKMEELITTVNKWLSLQDLGTDNYDTGLIMKAAALQFTCSLEPKYENNFDSLMEAMEILEPYSNSPKAFYIYMQTLVLLYEKYSCMGESSLAITKLKQAEEHFNKFTTKNKDVIWKFADIFHGEQPNPEQSEALQSFLFYSLQNLLYTYYHDQNDEEKQLEYAMGAAKYTEYRESPSRVFTNPIADIAILFITHRYFKQADHLLAGLMYNLVQYRRTVHVFHHDEISARQSRVAFGYVLWGLKIVEYSLVKLECGREWPIQNDKFEEIDWLKEPGVALYANQFPLKLVETPQEIADVLKRVKNWQKKYVKLCQDAGKDGSDAGSKKVKQLEKRLEPFLKKAK